MIRKLFTIRYIRLYKVEHNTAWTVDDLGNMYVIWETTAARHHHGWHRVREFWKFGVSRLPEIAFSKVFEQQQ